MKLLLFLFVFYLIASDHDSVMHKERIQRPVAQDLDTEITRALSESLQKLNYAVKPKEVGEQAEKKDDWPTFRYLPK